jgi:hypothetical protein
MTVCMIRPVAEAAVTFADWGSYGRAMQSITADPDYQRLMAELTKTFEIVVARLLSAKKSDPTG